MRICCCWCLLLVIGPACAAAVGIDLGDRRRQRIEVPEPAWVGEAAARSTAQAKGSLIVYAFTTGNLAQDGFWTSGAVTASRNQPIVNVTGGLEAPQAVAWGVVELPAVVLVDHHGNPWSRLQGKEVKPAAVEHLVLSAEGMLQQVQAQVAEGIAKAVEQASAERKLPAAIAALNRYAALVGFAEAATARQELDRILAQGQVELQAVAAQLASDPNEARRQLSRFERTYAGTRLEIQAQRVRDGLPMELEPPAAGVAGADDAPVDFLGEP